MLQLNGSFDINSLRAIFSKYSINARYNTSIIVLENNDLPDEFFTRLLKICKVDAIQNFTEIASEVMQSLVLFNPEAVEPKSNSKKFRRIKRGDIYLCDLKGVVGSEQAGVRPCVIIQNNTGNYVSPTTIVVPCTTAIKKELLPTHVLCQSQGLEHPSVILCEHIRTISKKRLKEYLGDVPKEIMDEVDKALCLSIGLNSKKNNLEDL